MIKSDFDNPNTTSTLRLIHKAKQGDRNALDKLSKEYEGFRHYIVRSMLNQYNLDRNRNDDYEELLQIGRCAILKCVNRFNEYGEFKFSTYYGAVIKGDIKRWLRDSLNMIRIPGNIQEKCFTNPELKETMLSMQPIALSEDLDHLLTDHIDTDAMGIEQSISKLSNLEQVVFKSICFQGMTQKEVATELGYGTTQIWRIYDRSLKKMAKIYVV